MIERLPGLAWLPRQARFIALYFTGTVHAFNDARHALARVATTT